MDLGRIFRRFSSDCVEVYADFIDPFSYVGFYNLWRAAEPRSVALIWRGFEFNPDTPMEGYWLLAQGNSDVRAGMWASVREIAERSGLHLKEPQAAYNTRRAQHLAHRLPAGAEKNLWILSIFAAYFERQEDISQPALLTRLLEPYPPLAPIGERAVVEDRGGLEANRKEALSRAFPGLPGFVYRGRSLFGALSTSAWNSVFDRAGKELVCSIK